MFPQARSFIESENAKHDVVVWIKSWCPQCEQTICDYERVHTDVVVHDVDEQLFVEEELEAMTAGRLFPVVFVRGKLERRKGNDGPAEEVPTTAASAAALPMRA